MRLPVRLLFWPVLLWTLSAAAGCASIPQTHYYVLQLRGDPPPDPSSPLSAQHGLDVGVEAFRVDSPYDQDRIVYRVGPESPEVGFYSYHRWALLPSHMLPMLVAEGLRGTPGIASIAPTVPGHHYSAVLEGQLSSLEEVDTREGPEARVRFTLGLRLPDGTITWSETLSGEGLTRSHTVTSVVEQMGVAISNALAKGRAGLESAVASLNGGTERGPR